MAPLSGELDALGVALLVAREEQAGQRLQLCVEQRAPERALGKACDEGVTAGDRIRAVGAGRQLREPLCHCASRHCLGHCQVAFDQQRVGVVGVRVRAIAVDLVLGRERASRLAGVAQQVADDVVVLEARQRMQRRWAG
jgi:hypothetical protein